MGIKRRTKLEAKLWGLKTPDLIERGLRAAKVADPAPLLYEVTMRLQAAISIVQDQTKVIAKLRRGIL